MKKVYYGKAVYDNKEINAVIKVLKNEGLSLVDGHNVKKLEKTVSKIFGKKYGLMVNSGSSANLLALASFNFKKGSEIITPNLTFSTTVAPIYQLGLIPHFIGVVKNKFVADPHEIEKCINKRTVALMIPNLLGNIADWKTINKIAKKYNLKVIEDSADTIGYTTNKKIIGNFSDVVTNSFYASHIINGAGTGGMVCFNDQKLYDLKISHPDHKIIGVGAAAKANTFLNFYNIDSTVMDFITDSSPHKQGKYTPLTRIPIEDDNIFEKYDKVFAVILSWNISASLKQILLDVNPKIKFISTYDETN